MESRSLTTVEIDTLNRIFPEYNWVDWNDVAAYSDWCSWIDEHEVAYGLSEGAGLSDLLRKRNIRRLFRLDCREYYGEENIPNVNDPSEDTWA